ncbi:MAG: phosphate ABC transporter substrate-binding protein [Coriobacteriia bacterium]|nr:phosphate ABC transporter substrate-binding protein [Coriobacteriia bacterium]
MHAIGRAVLSRAVIASTISVVLGSVLLLGGCSNTSGTANSIVVSGSTTVLPIAEQAAEQFMTAHEGKSVLVSGMGSSSGIEAVSMGTAQIGTSSRELADDELKIGLTDIPIAHDGIAAIVSPSNPVKNLSSEQLRDIFAGNITNWKELGGPDLEIERINRDEASGTREAFSKIIMGTASFNTNSVVLPGTGQVREVVGRTKGAIGYISVGFVTDDVKALSVDGVAPTVENVTSKKYPIARELHFFVKGTPTGLTKEYIDYVLSDAVQNGPVVEAGFIPAAAKTGGE